MLHKNSINTRNSLEEITFEELTIPKLLFIELPLEELPFLQLPLEELPFLELLELDYKQL